MSDRISFSMNLRTGVFLGLSAIALAACEGGEIIDFRPSFGGGNASNGVTIETAARPEADDRGVISYPNYQVAVARKDDTITEVANRVGLTPMELATYNGVSLTDTLRAGEIIALPRRVSEPSPLTGAVTTGPIVPADEIDITTLASGAITRAGDTPVATPVADQQTGIEPVRHQVERGETAYSIARLYQVSVRSLADWNALGTDLDLREGQFLLIPAAEETAAPAPAATTTEPGAGTVTPVPPSASTPLPAPDPVVAAPVETPAAPDLGPETTPAASASRMSTPVSGSIIRTFSTASEGLDYSAAAGASVKATMDGTVAAITTETGGATIVVVRHEGNLFTIYSNVEGVTVAKKDKVTRGQTLAKIRGGDAATFHFEVRQGLTPVDPEPYFNG